jgi:hypothetical protein
MWTTEDCHLKADNYALAAQASPSCSVARAYIRLAAIWRNRALRVKLAQRSKAQQTQGDRASAQR